MKPLPDSEFQTPGFVAPPAYCDYIYVKTDSMQALLAERKLLREALTSAQDRCGRLLEENREMKRKLEEATDAEG